MLAIAVSGSRFAVALPGLMTVVGAGLIEMRNGAFQTPISEAALGELGPDIFRVMADGAPVPLWMADASGQSTFHNQAWLDFTGRTRAELGGRAWLESLHPDDSQRAIDTYRQAFRERRKFQMEYRLRRHDGQYRWTLDMGAPCFGPGGNFAGFVGASIDITELKDAEALAAQFGRILDSSLNEIYVFDAATLRFTHVNHGARSNLGYSMDELRQMTPLDLKPEFTMEKLEELIRPLRTGKSDQVMFETVHRRKDGSTYPVEVRLQFSKRAESPVFFALISDITERRRGEELLQGRNKVLEQLATGAPLRDILTLIAETTEEARPELICSILLVDKETRCLRHGAAPSLPEFYNDTVDGIEIGPGMGSCGTAAYTGERVVVEDIMTHPYWALFKVHAERAGVKACWSEPIKSSTGDVLGTFAIYSREINAPGARDIELITSMAHLAGIAIERKRDEQESAAGREQAEIANRTKTEFLANMSHELRSPLNSVLGLAEIMKDELFGPLGSERYHGYADDIYQSAKHLLDVITDILDISKIEAGKLNLYEGEVNVAGIVETCMRLMFPRASEAKVSLERDIAADLPKLYADSRKAKQILLNLLSNAVKFTPKGGKVTISVRLNAAGELCLAVADTGIGIAPANIEKALTAFTQIDSSLSRKYEGTGLGLPITKALVELHGGRLAIESELGKGTTVTVTFPANRVMNGAADR
jgi:PAS domain S-box-containing protein